MISQTAEYALRAVVCLATHSEDSLTTQEIAKITKVPAGYLSKVLQALSRAGIVNSQRGLHGGFTLMQPAEETSVLDVVNAVDPIKHIRSCPLGLKSHGEKLCPLHQRIEDSIAMIEKTFGNSNIADLLQEPDSVKPLCDALAMVPAH